MNGRQFKGHSSRLEMVIERIQSTKENSTLQENDSSSSTTSSREESAYNGLCGACNRTPDGDCIQKMLPFPRGCSTTGTQFPTPISRPPDSPVAVAPETDEIIDLTSPINRSPILIQDGSSPKPLTSSPLCIAEVIEVRSSSQSPASVTYSPSPLPQLRSQNPERRSQPLELASDRTASQTSSSMSPPTDVSPSGGIGIVSSTSSPKAFAFDAPTWNPLYYEVGATPFVSTSVWPAMALTRTSNEIPNIYTPHRWGQGQISLHDFHPPTSFQAHGSFYGGEPEPSSTGLLDNCQFPARDDSEYIDSDSAEDNEAECLAPDGYEWQRPTSTWTDISRPESRYMQHSGHSQFDCLHCPRKFKHKRSRDRHLKLHTGDKKYKCRECYAAFARSDHLKIHVGTHAASHRRQRSFKCQCCDNGYDSAAALAFHEKSHILQNVDPRKPSCDSRSCNNNFRSTAANAFDCSHCPDVFGTPSELAKHIVSVRTEQLFEEKIKEIIEKLYTCIICKKRFTSSKDMEEHLRNGHIMGDRSSFQENIRDSSAVPEPPEVGTDRQIDPDHAPQPIGPKRKVDKAIQPDPDHTPEKRIRDEDNPDKTYICSNCFAELPDFQSFLQHMEVHMVVPSTSNDSGFSNPKSRKVVSTLDDHNCCCKCEKTFDRPDEFLNHMAWDHVKPVYKCAICNEICDNKISIKEHMRNTHSQKHYQCNMCIGTYSIFHDAIAAKRHITVTHSRAKQQEGETSKDTENTTVTKIKYKLCQNSVSELAVRQNRSCTPPKGHIPIQAPSRNDNEDTRPGPGQSLREFQPNFEDCNKTSDTAKELMKEFPTMESLNNKCPYCNEQSKSRSEFMNHIRSRHQPTEKMYKCNICDELFETVEKLGTHKLKHCKIFRGDNCVQCKEAVNHRELFFAHLFKHNVTYANDKRIFCLPFVCVVCSQTLQSKLEVALHAAYHLKHVSRPQAKESGHLQTKMKKAVPEHGTATPEVTLSEEILALHCHLCKKSLASKENLQTHLIEHNFFGMNEYSCYVCSSVFTAASGLQTHLLEHRLSEKPYQCSACHEGFLFRTELENHKYIHMLQPHTDIADEDDQNEDKKCAISPISQDISAPCESK